MKIEMKVGLISVVICILFMVLFGYVSAITQYTYYVHQVGIYKDEENKNEKLEELESKGCVAMSYKKDDQFYVISLITTSKKEIDQHADEIKGIVKKYQFTTPISNEELLEELENEE